jgi:hypothetical protein
MKRIIVTALSAFALLAGALAAQPGNRTSLSVTIAQPMAVVAPADALGHLTRISVPVTSTATAQSVSPGARPASARIPAATTPRQPDAGSSVLSPMRRVGAPATPRTPM